MNHQIWLYKNTTTKIITFTSCKNSSIIICANKKNDEKYVNKKMYEYAK